MTTHHFKDPVLQEQFDTEGYVIVPLLCADSVAQINAVAREILPTAPIYNDPEDNLYSTYFDVSRQQAASDKLMAVAAPKLMEMFSGFTVFSGDLFYKAPHVKRMRVHLHRPFIAQYEHTVINCWCPLEDCGESNAVLQIVPRSHIIHQTVQGARTHEYWSGFEDKIPEKYLKTFSIRAGEAILFNDALLHGASHNLQAKPRVVAHFLIFPDGSTPIFSVNSVANCENFDLVRATSQFCYSDMANGTLPPREEWDVLGTYVSSGVQLTEAQFDALLAGCPLPQAEQHDPSIANQLRRYASKLLRRWR